jgi:hypothetical protein
MWMDEPAWLTSRVAPALNVTCEALPSCWEPNQPEYDDLIDGSRLERLFFLLTEVNPAFMNVD